MSPSPITRRNKAAVLVAGLVAGVALAEYLGATIERSETDDGGRYEAHVVTAEDEELTVLVDEAFAVTGTADHGSR